ncbi:MAG: peroxiredoxin family protein [Alphaproteobacteria bacterium]|nr:peroxiredoxin family protein [Alphaproteobacteria bacterium]
MRDDLPESPVTLDEYAQMDMAAKRDVWLEISDITPEQFDAHMAEQKAREAIVPKVGAEAPDFVADVLGENRQRTGAQVRLSDLRGKPVGIVFGSFT